MPLERIPTVPVRTTFIPMETGASRVPEHLSLREVQTLPYHPNACVRSILNQKHAICATRAHRAMLPKNPLAGQTHANAKKTITTMVLHALRAPRELSDQQGTIRTAPRNAPLKHVQRTIKLLATNANRVLQEWFLPETWPPGQTLLAHTKELHTSYPL